MRHKHRIIKLLLLILFCLVVLVLLLRQPWQTKKLILSANIPSTGTTVELWEKPYWCLVANEYHTWLVIRSDDGQREWHTIDEQYITFTHVVLFLSADGRYLRVETSGQKKDITHMIAEYDLIKKVFRAESGGSVKNKEGWILLKEQVIR